MCVTFYGCFPVLCVSVSYTFHFEDCNKGWQRRGGTPSTCAFTPLYMVPPTIFFVVCVRQGVGLCCMGVFHLPSCSCPGRLSSFYLMSLSLFKCHVLCRRRFCLLVEGDIRFSPSEVALRFYFVYFYILWPGRREPASTKLGAWVKSYAGDRCTLVKIFQFVA